MLLSQALCSPQEIQTILRLLGSSLEINTSAYLSISLQMPYEIVKVLGGFKVRRTVKEKNGRYKYFSKDPLTKARAEAQLRALYARESGKPNPKKTPKK